jgi:trehalose-6-phosphate synthase
MPDSPRLIVVSNRLQVALLREDTEWKTKRTAGGLATAMDPILKRGRRSLDWLVRHRGGTASRSG